MATKDRRKAPGRIAVLVATGLASASFLFAIVSSPTSSQAAPVAQVSTAISQTLSSSTTLTDTASTAVQTPSAQTSVTQSTTSTARLRTRGS